MQTTNRVYEGMRVLKVKVFSLPHIFQVLYVLCFTSPRYQVSVYWTIAPLVYFCPKDECAIVKCIGRISSLDMNLIVCTKWIIFMPPTLKKWGGIFVSACPYVCMYVFMFEISS